jgi:hypothetical protein
MADDPVSQAARLAASPLLTTPRVGQSDESSWFLALARAWGTTLDAQAAKIQELSDGMGQGLDNPSQIVELTAESMRMQFLANSQSTSTNSVGQALETMARKQ